LKRIQKLIYILTVLGILYFLYFHRKDLTHLTHIHPAEILLLSFVAILPGFMNSLIFRHVISLFNIHLKFVEWYGLTISNTMYNYILPARSGMALRAVYLSKYHHFSIPNYISLTAATYMFGFLNASFLATIICIFLTLHNQLEHVLFLKISSILFLASMTLLVLLGKFNPSWLSENNKVTRILKKIALGLTAFKKNRRHIVKLMLLHLLFILITSLKLTIVFWVIDLPVSYLKIILINSLIALSLVISITPGNLGIKEGIIGISSGILGIQFDQAVLGAVLDRIVSMIVIMILGLIFSNRLLKRIPL